MSGSLADAELLFTEHQRGVFRYLCRIVGRTETARDLTQEVFLRVSRSPAPDADSAGRRAWVFKIARNLALNHLRDTRHEAGTVELVESAEPAVQELGAAIRQALDGLHGARSRRVPAARDRGAELRRDCRRL